MENRKKVFRDYVRAIWPAIVAVIFFGSLILFLIIPTYENGLIEARKETIHELTNSVVSLLANYEQRVEIGELTLEEAQERALDRVENLRYGEKNEDYFWINDLDHNLLMHPFQPDLVGDNLYNMQDAEGNYFIREFVDTAQQPGGGFVNYVWQARQDPNVNAPKLSYVRLFEPWGWVVGSGIYLDEVNATISRTRMRAISAVLFFLGLLAVWSIYLLWRSQRSEASRIMAETALKASEAQLSTIFDSSFQYVWVLNTTGKLINANQTSLDQVDLDIQDVEGQFFWETPWWEGSEIAETQIINSVQQCILGKFVRLDTVYFGELANSVAVDISLKPIFDQQKRVEMIIVEARDISERVNAEEKIKSQLEKLNILYQIDQAIIEGRSINAIGNTCFDLLQSIYSIDAMALWIFDEEGQFLSNIILRGNQGEWQGLNFRLGESFVGRVALEQRVFNRKDRASIPKDVFDFFMEEDIVDFAGFPLIAHGKLEGVLEIFHRSLFAFDDEDWRYLDVVAGQLAIALDNIHLLGNLRESNLELRNAYDLTLEGWAKALEIRDQETDEHSKRITDLTIDFAIEMGFSSAELIHVRRGAILHDIGKMGVPDEILLKEGPLDEHEWKIMKMHPVYAHKLLSPIPFLRPALDIPYCHHEWWDGSGYPRGLKGEEIPLAARIFAVIDVWDALTHDRPYRKAWTEEKVFEYLLRQSGVQFDPQVVARFLEMMRKTEENSQA